MHKDNIKNRNLKEYIQKKRLTFVNLLYLEEIYYSADTTSAAKNLANSKSVRADLAISSSSSLTFAKFAVTPAASPARAAQIAAM